MASLTLLILVISLLLSLTSSFQPTITLKQRPSTRTFGKVKLTYNGKQAMVAEGSKMSAACSKLGYKPKYSCKK